MTVKNSFLFGRILIGLFILLAAGTGLLLLLLDEASDGREDISEFTPLIPSSFSLGGEQESEGNGFTGQAAGWLFGIACVPVIFCLTTRFLSRRLSLQSRLKGSLEWFTRMNKKHLMPFHTYLSILALFLAFVHLLFSSCPNPLPELGLIIAGILVVTGLIIKLRIATKIFPKTVKYIYQFHTSLVVSGILVFVLLAGHTLMD